MANPFSIEFSYADHKTLLGNPLATIIDLTALSMGDGEALIKRWQKITSGIPLDQRIEHELSRIDPLLERVARHAYGIDLDLLRNRFRQNAASNLAPPFMGLFLIRQWTEQRLQYTFRKYYESGASVGFYDYPYIAACYDITNPKFAELRQQLAEFIFLKSHDFLHATAERTKPFGKSQPNDTIMLMQKEENLRAAMLLTISSDSDYQDHVLTRYTDLKNSISDIQITDAREFGDVRESADDFLNLNAGYALLPDRLPPLLNPPEDQPWRRNKDDLLYQSVESFRPVLREIGRQFRNMDRHPIAAPDITQTSRPLILASSGQFQL